MDSKVDHVWHVWINRESDRLRQWEKDNPTGETKPEERRGKTIQVPVRPQTPLELIDPHGRDLYDFKAAMQMLPWLAKRITAERTKSLPMVHQQCSHSPPEQLDDNYLTCGLGQRLDKCPILERLRATFSDFKGQPNSYYASIADEQVDEIAAMTCVWHMLMGTESFVDWQEGAVQDVSDRKFWQRVYSNLSEAYSHEESTP